MQHNVLFDFGNVLYWFDYERFFTRAATHSRHTPAELRELLFRGADSVSLRFETGRIPAAGFMDWLRRDAGIDLPENELRDAFVDIFTANEPVIALANRLADRVRIGLVSNTNEIHFESFVRRIPVLSRFSAVGLSYRAGAMKPEPPIFQTVLDQLGCRAEDCVFIDDIVEYVAAARNMGFDAIHYLPGVDLESELADRGITAQE